MNPAFRFQFFNVSVVANYELLAALSVRSCVNEDIENEMEADKYIGTSIALQLCLPQILIRQVLKTYLGGFKLGGLRSS